MEDDLSKQEAAIIAVVQQFLTELDIQRATHNITLDTHLDRDLSVDSLGRVELIHRIEKQYDVQLPDSVIAEAETLRDIATALRFAKPQEAASHTIHQQLEPVRIDPSQAQTLIEVLELYGTKLPDRPHIYLQKESGKERVITYGDLYTNAEKVACALVELGLKQAETVAIMLPTSADFFYVFMGVMLAGGVPVPIYPPFRPDRIGEYAVREATILKNAEVRFLITFHRAEALSRLLRVFIPSLKSVLTTKDLGKCEGKPIHAKIQHDDAAMIQYTSGSTSAPKGVLLSHRNLLANIRAYGEEIQIRPKDVCISWLPLYHDMGLIGAWFGGFYHGIPTAIMSPLSFLNRPERWLWAIHSHRGTISAGPNFAYELCVRKIDDAALEGLDLSSWRLAFNGAEAVNPNTLKRFIKRFKPYGFDEKNMFPVYGLAESSVALTFPPVGRGIKIDTIKRESLEDNLKAQPASKDSKNVLEFVGCGMPLKGHAIRVVDNDNNPLPDRNVGNLQFQGPSTMEGYYRNNEATAAVYHDGWWDTGDLAYLIGGELFITGRKKDLIIKAGRNYYPEEIEQVTWQVEGVRKGCVVAFGVHDTTKSTEKLVIVAETVEKSRAVKQEITANILDKVTNILGIPPDEIVLVPPKTVPKTSSGKLRRSTCKQDYIDGKIAKPRNPLWLQLTKLYSRGIYTTLLKWFKFSGKLLYSLYVFVLAVILIIPILLTVMIPKQKTARKMAKSWSRVIFRLAFCPLKVVNPTSAEANQTAVYCANHLSYIDALILIAVLPTHVSIISKQELATTFLIGAFVRKLGHLFVERFDISQSVADADTFTHALAAGTSIAIFPEGTFSYASGLRPFKLGAFKIAAETDSPIVPMAINGSRQIMRGNNVFLLQPNRLIVTFCSAIKPGGKDWEAVNELKTTVRQEIGKHCGEELINA